MRNRAKLLKLETGKKKRRERERERKKKYNFTSTKGSPTGVLRIAVRRGLI